MQLQLSGLRSVAQPIRVPGSCSNGLVLTEADLQIAASFLPGRIADSHITLVAKHLVSMLSSVSEKTGLVGKPVALLTRELGEPCLHWCHLATSPSSLVSFGNFSKFIGVIWQLLQVHSSQLVSSHLSLIGKY